MKYAMRGAACSAMLLVLGCQHQPPGAPLTDDALALRLREAALSAYPENFQVLQRLLLTRKDTDTALTEHIRVAGRTALQLAVVTDMGTSILNAKIEANGDVAIGRNRTEFSDRLVRGGFLRDIAAIYSKTPREDAQLVQHQDGNYGLIQTVGKTLTEEFVYAASTLQRQSYLLRKGSRTVFEMHFLDYERVDGWGQVVPRTVKVWDRRRRYSARYTVKSILEMPAEE